MSKQGHYPDYNVMDAHDEWDDHTQVIVTSRLEHEYTYTFLTLIEAEALRAICSLLVDDSRVHIIDYILIHIDKTLSQTVGESQRKLGVPKASTLIREGLKQLDQASLLRYENYYIQLEPSLQKQIIQELSGAAAQPPTVWQHAEQQALFKKLLNLTLEGYYSHPEIWSEIGYGGPAYPRGYVRTGLGQLDPWEAQPKHDET